MINPTGELLTAGLECLMPMMALMLGALVIGSAIGYTAAPSAHAATAPLRAELEAVGRRVKEQEQKLATAGSVMTQRNQLLEREHGEVRRALEQEIAALNAEVGSLKMALAAAKRTVPEAPANDQLHAERMAELERQAARVRELERRLASTKAPAAKGRKPKENKPVPLPEQVYRVMSAGFGRRIQPDDLKLVEGIGPKIAEHLAKHGLKTWSDLASAKPNQLRKVLDEGGDRFQWHDPTSWPEQCKLMVENRWDELRRYQQKLSRSK